MDLEQYRFSFHFRGLVVREFCARSMEIGKQSSRIQLISTENLNLVAIGVPCVLAR
jgi:hypothetical protein